MLCYNTTTTINNDNSIHHPHRHRGCDGYVAPDPGTILKIYTSPHFALT